MLSEQFLTSAEQVSPIRQAAKFGGNIIRIATTRSSALIAAGVSVLAVSAVFGAEVRDRSSEPIDIQWHKSPVTSQIEDDQKVEITEQAPFILKPTK